MSNRVILYNKGLYTKACCKGYHDITDVNIFTSSFLKGNLDFLAYARCITAPHIAFADDIKDVFDYLSVDLINNPHVELSQKETH